MRSIFILSVLACLALGDYVRDDLKGVVMDSSTNLMWQDDSSAKTNYISWSDSIAYCEALSLAGYGDWRLPNLNELFSISSNSRKPAIDVAFKNVVSNSESDNYWSSTTNDGDSDFAWYIQATKNNDYWKNKSNSAYVRCVRSIE